MQYKMLRKNERGEVEVFYAGSWNEKQLHDTRRKKYRQLENEVPKPNRKEDYRKRQQIIRDLREVVTKLKGEST